MKSWFVGGDGSFLKLKILNAVSHVDYFIWAAEWYSQQFPK